MLLPETLVEELVIPFTAVDEELVKSLASQAAVAFENTQLIDEIKTLFNAFVYASVTAVEQRDPTTSGHSRRVAELTVGLAETVDALNAGPFSTSPSRATSWRRSATPACCTTSARWACARSCSSRARSSTWASCC